MKRAPSDSLLRIVSYFCMLSDTPRISEIQFQLITKSLKFYDKILGVKLQVFTPNIYSLLKVAKVAKLQ